MQHTTPVLTASLTISSLLDKKCTLIKDLKQISAMVKTFTNVFKKILYLCTTIITIVNSK